MRYGASGRDVSGHDVLYTGESRHRFDLGDSIMHNNNDIVGMSLCTVDVADLSYLDLPTPAGSGDCDGHCDGDHERPVNPDHGCQYRAFADGLQIRRLDGDPLFRRCSVRRDGDLNRAGVRWAVPNNPIWRGPCSAVAVNP